MQKSIFLTKTNVAIGMFDAALLIIFLHFISPPGIDYLEQQNKFTLADVAAITGVVALLFVLDVFILWALIKVGGPLKADVRLTVKRFGGSLWITGAGLFGAFFAVAILDS